MKPRVALLRTLSCGLLLSVGCGAPAGHLGSLATAGPARFTIPEGRQVNIARGTQNPSRFIATFTLANVGDEAGRPRCTLWVGDAKERLRNMPLLGAGEERALTRSIVVQREVWEIDGDVKCR